MKQEVLSFEDCLSKWGDLAKQSTVKSFYSSFFKGYGTDPRGALIAFEDHLVHRGDGVFEAIKFVDKKIYLLEPHLLRMQRSAEKVFLDLPEDFFELPQILVNLIELSGLSIGIIRCFISRGMGGFSVNPLDCPQSQLHVFVTSLLPISEEKYALGVSIDVSRWIGKQGFWSQIKSCNYLPNALLKRESVLKSVDFLISLNEDGSLGEGPTENIIWVDSQGNLCKPKANHILQGCTMNRTLRLAKEQLGINTLEKALTVKELESAKELMMVGTTLDVLPISRWAHRAYPVGPVYQTLLQLVRQDQKQKSELENQPFSWLLSAHPRDISEPLPFQVYGKVHFDKVLKVEFRMDGDVSALCLPDFEVDSKNRTRRHDLWRSTCFEVFFSKSSQGSSEQSYHEVNVSTSGSWNVYDFSSYRQPQVLLESSQFQVQNILKTNDGVCFEIAGDFQDSSEYQISLACVLQTIDQKIHYKALKHVSVDKPDFHTQGSRVLKRMFI